MNKKMAQSVQAEHIQQTVQEKTHTASMKQANIPFNKLKLAERNVRSRIDKGTIEQLADDILNRGGLLQNLVVYKEVDNDGKHTGFYKVFMGGRRWRALKFNVKRKAMKASDSVPCFVCDPENIIIEDYSLAENTIRENLHPLDEFNAYKAMSDNGLSNDEIAARHFVSVSYVRQRLGLAAVAPDLLKLFARDEMSLAQVQALTLDPDHKNQRAAWEASLAQDDRSERTIRRVLSGECLRSDNRFFSFVGLEDYEAAGGRVRYDLFSTDGIFYVLDKAIVEQLALQKLDRIAEELKAQGWAWCETALQFDYGHLNRFIKLPYQTRSYTDEENTLFDAIADELTALDDRHHEEGLSEEEETHFYQLQAQIERLEDSCILYDEHDLRYGGCLVCVDNDGTAKITVGLARPEDWKRREADLTTPVTGTAENGAPDPDNTATIGQQNAASIVSNAVSTPEEPKSLSDALLTELSSYRTVALRHGVTKHPREAMTLALFELVCSAFKHASCHALHLNVTMPNMRISAPDLEDSLPAKELDEMEKGWRASLPLGDETFLWQHITDMQDDERMALFAFLIGRGVDAMYEKTFIHGGFTPHSLKRREETCQRVMQAVQLDIAETGWEATEINYLARVPKPKILEAVTQACGAEKARYIEYMKKPMMAREAARLMSGSGWLPEILRTKSANNEAIVRSVGKATEETVDVVQLPAWLDEKDKASDTVPEQIQSSEQEADMSHAA